MPGVLASSSCGRQQLDRLLQGRHLFHDGDGFVAHVVVHQRHTRVTSLRRNSCPSFSRKEFLVLVLDELDVEFVFVVRESLQRVRADERT